MNVYDIVLLIILGLCMFYGYSRGLIPMFVELAILTVAFVLAVKLTYLSHSPLVFIGSVVLIFLAGAIGFLISRKLRFLNKILPSSRFGGMIPGLLFGVVACFIVILLSYRFFPRIHPYIHHSVIARTIVTILTRFSG